MNPLILDQLSRTLLSDSFKERLDTIADAIETVREHNELIIYWDEAIRPAENSLFMEFTKTIIRHCCTTCNVEVDRIESGTWLQSRKHGELNNFRQNKAIIIFKPATPPHEPK